METMVGILIFLVVFLVGIFFHILAKIQSINAEIRKLQLEQEARSKLVNDISIAFNDRFISLECYLGLKYDPTKREILTKSMHKRAKKQHLEVLS